MNRLQYEQSPYLLQHADNPVEWYPWGDEAFERATSEDKPIFLSIGYSTCHWCHVMEHESFEDETVAALMNETFINIKVDREERPDIDQLYMSVAQILTGRGGWPLTIIMTPDQEPFFAGTYIPKESRGQMGMIELIPQIASVWQSRRADIASTTASILDALKRMTESPDSGSLFDASILDRTFSLMAEQFDGRNGGFGTAPKFPTAHNFYFLLRYWKRTDDVEALRMVERTLVEMRRGGVYDQIGFGFHRYSTDASWRVPHFEKMLYDQALLSLAYIEAFEATGKEFYSRTAQEILTYVLRDMRLPEGGFASAEDADSDGEEGLFYVWNYDELRSILSDQELTQVTDHFAVEPTGNFRDEVSGESSASNILFMHPSDASANSDSLGIPAPMSEIVREKLFLHREARIHPFKDDKILTSWNSLMIAAFSKIGGVLANQEYLDAAKRAADFVLTTLRTESGQLLHRYRDGEASISAYATDYAYLIWGLIELYEATFESSYLREALSLMETFLEEFWDGDRGGFFLTSSTAEGLLIRPREDTDGALPSANSVALLNLLRLGRMSQNIGYEERAVALIRSEAGLIERIPSAFTFLLSGLDFQIGPTFEVVIAGDEEASDTRLMAQALRREFAPSAVILFRPDQIGIPEIAELSPFVQYNVSLDGKATAYVCRDYACELPVTEITKMLDLIRTESAAVEG